MMSIYACLPVGVSQQWEGSRKLFVRQSFHLWMIIEIPTFVFSISRAKVIFQILWLIPVKTFFSFFFFFLHDFFVRDDERARRSPDRWPNMRENYMTPTWRLKFRDLTSPRPPSSVSKKSMKTSTTEMSSENIRNLILMRISILPTLDLLVEWFGVWFRLSIINELGWFSCEICGCSTMLMLMLLIDNESSSRSGDRPISCGASEDFRSQRIFSSSMKEKSKMRK